MRALVAVLLLGCASPNIARIAVHRVEWNPNKADVGSVAAVAESGEDVFVFGSTGAHILAGGSLVASDNSVHAFRSATTIPAADGNGAWVIAIDDHGRILRVRDRSKLEPISARFGLEKSDVLSVASMGSSRVAFALATSLAIVDGERIARHDYAFSSIACGSGHGAGIHGAAVMVFDPFRGIDRTYQLDARFITVDAKGRAVAANERGIWREEDGKLTLRYRSAHDSLRGIVTSAENVWFADGDELGLLDAGLSTDLHASGTLLPSPSGDVWTLTDGKLARYTTARPNAWATIGPIYTRVCSSCHGPSGSAGLDLSTPARWESNRAVIDKRVVRDKTMPPRDHPLTEAERAVITTFVK